MEEILYRKLERLLLTYTIGNILLFLSFSRLVLIQVLLLAIPMGLLLEIQLQVELHS